MTRKIHRKPEAWQTTKVQVVLEVYVQPEMADTEVLKDYFNELFCIKNPLAKHGDSFTITAIPNVLLPEALIG